MDICKTKMASRREAARLRDTFPGQDLYLALRSFSLLSEKLRFNICELVTSHLANWDLPDMEERIQEHLSPALQYAATEWWEHVAEIPEFNSELHSALSSFSNEQLLFWVEVLSLMGWTSLFGPACETILKYIKVSNLLFVIKYFDIDDRAGS